MDEETKARGRIEITLGKLSFAGEGEQVWLGEQLDKLLNSMLNSTQPQDFTTSDADSPSSDEPTSALNSREKFTDPLASYIRKQSAESN